MHAAAGVLSHRVRADFAQVALNPCAQWNGQLASRVLPLKSWIAILHSKISLLRPIVLNPLSAEALARIAETARGCSATRTQRPCLVYSFHSATQWTRNAIRNSLACCRLRFEDTRKFLTHLSRIVNQERLCLFLYVFDVPRKFVEFSPSERGNLFCKLTKRSRTIFEFYTFRHDTKGCKYIRILLVGNVCISFLYVHGISRAFPRCASFELYSFTK